jgi:hypothetical protein
VTVRGEKADPYKIAALPKRLQFGMCGFFIGERKEWLMENYLFE